MRYVFGDSHVRVFGRLVRKQADDVEIISNHGQNFIDMDVTQNADSVRVFSDKVEKFAAIDLTLTGADTLVFSAPLHSSPVARHPMWRSNVHWRLAGRHPNRNVVSDNFFDTVVQSRLRSALVFLQSAKALGADVVVIEPPLLSRRCIALSPLTEEVLAANDQLYRAAVRRALDAIGVPVISTPPQTNDGYFMLPEFQATNERDLHHGNAAYAELTTEDVMEYLRTGKVNPPPDPTAPSTLKKLLARL